MNNIVDIFGVVLLLILVWFLSENEKKKFGTLITPFNTLALPYLVIVLMINLIAIHFKFYSVTLKCNLFVMLCLLFFFMGGRLVGLFFNQEHILLKHNADKLTKIFKYYRPLFISLAIISILAGLYNLYTAINAVGGWTAIATEQFEDAYGKGLFSHIMVINRAAFIFLMADFSRNKSKINLLLLTFIFLLILILQIKNHIITIILAGLFFTYFYGKLRVNLRRIALYSLIFYFLFVITYLIGFSRLGLKSIYSTKIYLYLTNHFFTYLFGGPIGFSRIIDNPVYPYYSYKEIFAVPINVYYSLILKKPIVDPIIYHWVSVSRLYHYFNKSNVFGLFGMLYAYIGYLQTLVYMFVLGVTSYLFLYLSLKKRFYIGNSLIYSFLLSFLAISFFGLYFNLLLLYEAALIMLIIPVLYRFARLLLFSKSEL